MTSLTEGLGPFNGLRAPVFGAALALLGVLIMWGFLHSLGWAIVFAIITWPLYTRLLRRLPEHRRGGVLAPLFFTLIIGVMLVVALCIAAIAVGREALVLMHWAAEAIRTGPSVPDRLPRLPTIGGYLAEWWRANLTDPVAASRIMGHINSGMLVAWTGALGAQFLRRSLLFLLMLLTLFFLFRDGAWLARQLLMLADRILGYPSKLLASHLTTAVRVTVNGLVLVGIGEGILAGVAWAVAGFPHPALFGLLTGAFAIIPFGAPAVFTAGSLALLALGRPVAAALLFGFGMFVIFVADHFIRPALISGSTRLPFLLVLLGILGRLERFGVIGLFVGPAVMAVLIALWREWVKASPARDLATGRHYLAAGADD